MCVKDGISSRCSVKQTCTPEFNNLSDGQTNGYFIDWMNSQSLNNWIQYLNLRCSNGWEIGMFGSCFFFGYVVGIFFLAKRGDTIGRIKMLRFGLITSTILYFFIDFVSQQLYFHYVLIFIYGFLANIRTNICFIYSQETVVYEH